MIFLCSKSIHRNGKQRNYINQHNWVIDTIEILKACKMVAKTRCCWYTKDHEIDGYSKRLVKWLVRKSCDNKNDL